MFENRRWLVIPTSITSSINFNEVLESSLFTLRLSLDGSETFVKYDVTVITASYTQSYYNPETHQTQSYIVEAGIYGRPDIYSPIYPEYLYQPMLDLLATPFWTQPMLTGSIE
jgi:hypothetical protein